MKTTLTRITSDIETPNAPSAALDNTIARQMDAVKSEVFAKFHDALDANEHLLRLAIIEADAAARQTDYPYLVFPLLADEKAQNAARWQFRQQFLLRSNDALAA